MSKFKAILTEETTEIKGSTTEILTGLVMYIETLLNADIKKTIIRKVVDLALEGDSENKKVETVIDNDKIKVQKIDLNGLSKEEARDLLDKEIFNKLFN